MMLNRRSFLGLAAGLAIADHGAETAAPVRVIDTHIHLYDPSRAQGVPWPNKDNKVLYRASLPDRYRPIAQPHPAASFSELPLALQQPWPQWWPTRRTPPRSRPE
jgi:hypothetical protein